MAELTSPHASMTSVLTIEKLVHGGYGLARLPDGLAVFIPGTIPGEKIEAEVVRRRKDYAFARPLRIMEPSAHRIPPACRHYPECGGCQLLHVDYRMQTVLKAQMLRDSLERIMGPQGPLPDRVTASPETFNYRHRLKFRVKPATGEPGFLEKGSHRIVPIKKCLLARTEINTVLASLPRHPAWKRTARMVRHVTMGSSPEESRITVLLAISVPGGKPRRRLHRDIDDILKDIPEIKAIFLKKRGKNLVGPYPPDAPDKGKRIFSFISSAPGMKEPRIMATPGVFVQNNWKVNRLMVKKALEFSGGGKHERILDLHCGIGNFILALGARASKAMGVDSDAQAVTDAVLNAQALGIQADFINKTDHEAAMELLKNGESFDTVILDPPRGGCRGILPLLPALTSKRLIYISCDPPTLARDLKSLVSQGFHLESLHAFDMFPHTFHTEAMALLRRC